MIYTTTHKNLHNSYGVALGYEWIKPITKRWEAYYGLDVETGGSRESFTEIRTGYDPDATPTPFGKGHRSTATEGTLPCPRCSG